MADNDDKAQALIDGLVPKLMESLKDKIAEQVQSELKPFADKSSELLDELKDTQRDESAIKLLSEQVADLRGAPKGEPAYHEIDYEDARDTQKYQAARDKADKAGLPLRMVRADAS